jgi:hypothetical protein
MRLTALAITALPLAARTGGRSAVALALTALLLTNCNSDGEGTATPEATSRAHILLRPGDEADGMRLTAATQADPRIFEFCNPIILKPGTYARTCQVPDRQRLMIGHGDLAASAELLEQEWQAERWQLYLDGHQVDLAAFGTLPDRHFFESGIGEEVWLREWSVTIVNPTPGRHTLRYVQEQLPAANAVVGTIDTTWTFTVIRSPDTPPEETQS